MDTGQIKCLDEKLISGSVMAMPDCLARRPR